MRKSSRPCCFSLITLFIVILSLTTNAFAHGKKDSSSDVRSSSAPPPITDKKPAPQTRKFSLDEEELLQSLPEARSSLQTILASLASVKIKRSAFSSGKTSPKLLASTSQTSYAVNVVKRAPQLVLNNEDIRRLTLTAIFPGIISDIDKASRTESGKQVVQNIALLPVHQTATILKLLESFHNQHPLRSSTFDPAYLTSRALSLLINIVLVAENLAELVGFANSHLSFDEMVISQAKKASPITIDSSDQSSLLSSVYTLEATLLEKLGHEVPHETRYQYGYDFINKNEETQIVTAQMISLLDTYHGSVHSSYNSPKIKYSHDVLKGNYVIFSSKSTTRSLLQLERFEALQQVLAYDYQLELPLRPCDLHNDKILIELETKELSRFDDVMIELLNPLFKLTSEKHTTSMPQASASLYDDNNERENEPAEKPKTLALLAHERRRLMFQLFFPEDLQHLEYSYKESGDSETMKANMQLIFEHVELPLHKTSAIISLLEIYRKQQPSFDLDYLHSDISRLHITALSHIINIILCAKETSEISTTAKIIEEEHYTFDQVVILLSRLPLKSIHNPTNEYELNNALTRLAKKTGHQNEYMIHYFDFNEEKFKQLSKHTKKASDLLRDISDDKHSYPPSLLSSKLFLNNEGKTLIPLPEHIDDFQQAKALKGINKETKLASTPSLDRKDSVVLETLLHRAAIQLVEYGDTNFGSIIAELLRSTILYAAPFADRNDETMHVMTKVLPLLARIAPSLDAGWNLEIVNKIPLICEDGTDPLPTIIHAHQQGMLKLLGQEELDSDRLKKTREPNYLEHASPAKFYPASHEAHQSISIQERRTIKKHDEIIEQLLEGLIPEELVEPF
ncbi:hypothetical protein M3P05_09345 [Sansalvadorimonas sp. 2012CJ34-2]|uniref:Secreted effector protein n=1 Tax=Parendozoicomonas callyspongiae TaxID=2942213 RepID=A0ABT0PFI3_9GAMM|nr:hypothetical protein [Sansalvadorimonas sp. 2012CJ34-2]MCL6270137.1 hypothetical protein [Sansalvadorimonas sp. 2012CJ34-2]